MRSALDISPTDVEANVLMGIVAARKGNRTLAIQRLQAALETNDECYEAHVTLSTLLFAEDRPDQALLHGERAIALQPKDPAAYHHLARDLIAHRRTPAAIPYLRQALHLAPGSPNLLQDLATALAENGEREESVLVWIRLTQLHPKLLTGWLKLGGLYISAKKFKEAQTCAERSVQLAPDSPDAQLLMGLALLGGDGGAFAADRHLHKAVELNPNGLAGQSAYGLALQEMGRFEEAVPHFERVLEISPSHGQTYYSLLRARKATEGDFPLLEKLQMQLDSPAAAPLDRSYMHYALGKAFEDLGDFETSIRHFDRATELAAKTWFPHRSPDHERYSYMIQATKETFTPTLLEDPKRQRLNSSKPLLVVGMIRSGTTLVEQILSSHPEIKGAGELAYWHEESVRIWDAKSKTINERRLKDAAEGYIELLDRIGGSSARVVDKLPHNYTMLGFVLAAIPNTKVVYVRRHPIDNCLSIYTTAYQSPPEFALTRRDILFWYREHLRLMDHWRSILPSEQLLEVSYEDLVERREDVTREMIDFAGLDWNDACLDHESNMRSVNTPSAWQVRQPIYKTSVERWKRFEPWIEPFDELLPESQLPT